MKALTKRIICFIIAIASLTCLALSGCGKTEAHVCESKCPKCGYCLNAECDKPACELKCPGHKEEKATITSVEVTVSPKTDYYPGEVFDITGLVIKATLSNGKKKDFFDADFTTWTKKGEQLTKDDDKITVSIPGYDYTFDIAITVALPTDLTMTIDSSALKERYTTEETIDFSVITVRVATEGYTSILKSDEWKLKKGETEIADKTAVAAKDLGTGEVTLTIEYLPDVKKDIVLTIVEVDKIISPSFIEAEDCVYQLSGVPKDDKTVSSLTGTETTTPYTTKENTSVAQIIEDGVISGGGPQKIRNGTSGTGAVSSLGTTQNGRTVYFKFTVKVPETGNYKIKARAAGTSSSNIRNSFAVNINGAKGSDGKFTFTLNDKDQYMLVGNQLLNYCDEASLNLQEGQKFTTWYNMFFWGMLDIGTFELTKGENVIRIYMPNGFYGNIDYFEVVENDEPEEAKILSMRTGARVDLSKNAVYLQKGAKLTDILLTPALHPEKYTLLYIRLSSGKEVPITERMLNGKVDYDKTGEQTVTVTDPVSGEQASFKLIIEEMKED